MQITFKDIVELHHQPNKTGSFVQKYIFNYFSIILTYFFIRYTNFKPNHITALGFLLYLLSLFFLDSREYLLFFIFYWGSFVFDIIDGNIARLKKETSLVGAYLDIIIDWIKPSFAYLILFFLSSNEWLLYLIIINFLAAGSWRIYLNLLTNKDSQLSNLENKQKIKNRFKWINLSFISAIEVEFLVLGLYIFTFYDIFVYFAVLIRIKDFFKNMLSSLIKLNTFDKVQ